MRKYIMFIIIFLPILAACSGKSPTQSSSQIPGIKGYPATSETNNANNLSAYPVSTEPIEPTPTIDPALGVVKGKLYLQGKPVNNALLFLADVIQDTQGNDRMVSVDYNTQNRSTTQSDGSFAFVNIPTNKHFALVLVVIPNSYVLMTPGTEKHVIVDAKAGQEIDLGQLNYDALPIP